MEKPMTSIIIINYNTAKLTFECVESIFKFENQSKLEIIVVDNASKEEDYLKLSELLEFFDDVTIVRSKINLGFGGGNMLGTQFATGDFLCFLNSDTLLVEPIFKQLISFANSTSDFGVSGIQILDAEKKESISYRYFEGVRYKIFGRKFLELTQKKKIAQNHVLEVDFVLGSLMFFKKEIFNKIGGFDTNIFLYYEETDVCYRLKKLSYKSYFISDLKYIHLEGQSSVFNYNLKLEHWISYFYVTRKNFGLFKYFIIKYFLLLNYMFKAPFKKKNSFIFKKMLQMNESLAMSLKHQQKRVD